MLTRNGIAYNFDISPYKATVNYSKDDSITFTFSSELYKEKFLTKLDENRSIINNSLSKRFGFDIVNDKLSDIKLYSSTEKRGFLLEIKDNKYSCLSTIKLDGQNKIQKKSQEL